MKNTNSDQNPIDNLKISIVTTTYNSSSMIADCINSVNNQTWPIIEHIIIDGGSEDNTIEIVKSIPNRIKKIISEPDKGIYDAMNKGIQLATGNIVGILNSDDRYFDGEVIEKVILLFKETGCDAVYGNLDMVDSLNTDKIIRHWKSSPYKPGSFNKGWHPPHPTFFVKKEIYERYGLFDISLNVSADFELMLRFIEKYQIKVEYLDETIAKMRYGGESTGSLKKILVGNLNIKKAFKKNGIKVTQFYPIIRLLPKIKQFIIQKL